MKHTLALVQFVALFTAIVGYDSLEDTTDYIEVGEAPPRPITILVINSNATNLLNAIPVINSTNNTVAPQNHRIVGGRQISIQEAPWQAAIMREKTFTCGGSVISTVWVLTAAHCVHGSINRRYAVRAGSDYFKRGGQLRIVHRVTYHAGYNSRTSRNDIAMLRLRRGFTFNSQLQPIKLATIPLTPSSYSISGWGTLNENDENPTIRLRGVEVRPVGRTQCARNYRGIIKITSNMICASAPRQDSCQGDSGGALVSRNTQYGIVSFGRGCARADYPGVYTFIPKYTTWINTVVRTFGPQNSLRYLQHK